MYTNVQDTQYKTLKRERLDAEDEFAEKRPLPCRPQLPGYFSRKWYNLL